MVHIFSLKYGYLLFDYKDYFCRYSLILKCHLLKMTVFQRMKLGVLSHLYICILLFLILFNYEMASAQNILFNPNRHIVFPFEPEFDSSYVINDVLYRTSNRNEYLFPHINDFRRVNKHRSGKRTFVFKEHLSGEKHILTYRYDSDGYIVSETYDKELVRSYKYSKDHRVVYSLQLIGHNPWPSYYIIYHFNAHNVIDTSTATDLEDSSFRNKILNWIIVFDSGYVKQFVRFSRFVKPDTELYRRKLSIPASQYTIEQSRDVGCEDCITPFAAYRADLQGEHDSTLEFNYRGYSYYYMYHILRQNKKSIYMSFEGVENEFKPESRDLENASARKQVYYELGGKKYIYIERSSRADPLLFPEYEYFSRGRFPFYKWRFTIKNNLMGRQTTYDGAVLHFLNKYYIKY
jgi:hypothetical protein